MLIQLPSWRAWLCSTIIVGDLALWLIPVMWAKNEGASPPSCVRHESEYEAQNRMGDMESCLEETGNWCEKYHPQETEGRCLDVAYGVIPGPHVDDLKN